MKKANQDVRDTLKSMKVKQWELADRCGYSETRLCARLRKELPVAEKIVLITLIQKIAEEREVDS